MTLFHKTTTSNISSFFQLFKENATISCSSKESQRLITKNCNEFEAQICIEFVVEKKDIVSYTHNDTDANLDFGYDEYRIKFLSFDEFKKSVKCIWIGEDAYDLINNEDEINNEDLEYIINFFENINYLVEYTDENLDFFNF